MSAKSIELIHQWTAHERTWRLVREINYSKCYFTVEFQSKDRLGAERWDMKLKFSGLTGADEEESDLAILALAIVALVTR